MIRKTYSSVLAALGLTCLSLSGPGVARAWEISTHARVTKQAYLRSKLGLNEEELRLLGLRKEFNLLQAYFDIDNGRVERRIPSENLGSDIVINRQDITDSNLPASDEAGKMVFKDEQTYRRSPVGWLMRGAIREDDLGFIKVLVPNALGLRTQKLLFGHDPHDDPYAPPYLWRVVRHFYDPFNDMGFNVDPTCLEAFKSDTEDTYTAGPTSYAASPNWALGVDDAFATHPVETANRRNHFTIRDAREAMYRALTGTDSEGSSEIGPQTMTGSEIRNAYWATTFRALGDVVHLLQDTSQPQHTRNDPHSGTKVCFGDESAIEAYIEARAKHQDSVELSDVGTVLDLQPLDYGDYPIPSFARYSDYFSTARRETGTTMEKVAQGKGLADYSNRGFFTTGKNFGNTDYPLPVSDSSRYQTDQVELHLTDGIVQDKVLIGDVTDTVQGTVQSAALTSVGVMDEYIRNVGVQTTEKYSLQPANYDADAGLLLPRAVAYSAGLLNYFFRGHFDLAAGKFFALIDHSIPHSMNTEDLPIDSNTGKVFGFTKFKIKVRNDTNDIVPTGSSQAIPQEMTDGFLQAVVKYNLNHCYRPDLTGQFAPGEFPDGGVAADMPTVSTYSGCNGAVYVAHPFFDAGGGDGGGKLAAPTLQELVDRQDRVAISKRIPIGPGHDLERIPRSRFQPIDFDFRDDPIPVNARDIKLQIVYRGKLGSGDYVEDDAVVVTTVDISEPSYITFTNSSDYVNVNGFFLSYSAAVPTIQTLASNLRSTGDAEDEAEAESLEHRAEALIDPDVPITDFTCKDSEGDPDLITFQSLEAKRFVRVAALANTSGNTQLDLCTYKVTDAAGEQAQRLAVVVAARVNEDYYDRDKELFLFKEFPEFRGVVQKQGSPEFYENFAGWSAVYNIFNVPEDLFPPSDPPQKIQDIPNPINAQPSPVGIRCDYTWDDCSGGSG